MMKRKAADVRRRDLRELFDATADQGMTREAEHRRQAVGTISSMGRKPDIVEPALLMDSASLA